MTRTRRKTAALTLLSALACQAAGTWTVAARADGNIEAGRTLAITHCARCHAIPGHNPRGGIGSTPSFKVLTHIGDYVERMQTFFDRRPHRAFVRLEGLEQGKPDPAYATPIHLKVDDVDDLVAYVRSLQSK